MKKIIMILVIIPVMFAFAPVSLHAQTTIGHCYGYYYIDDPNYVSGDYYDIYLRFETATPSATNWQYINTVYYSGYPSTQFSNVNVGSVPHPPFTTPDFYSIRIGAAKNGGTPTANNSSYATPTVIDIYNTRFDANTNPIQVKFH
jgi:hypothetical protein